jgi:predicted amidohydrolase
MASTAVPPSSAPSFAGHPVVTALSALAAELNVFILIGSIAVRVDDDDADRRFYNRSVLLGPSPRNATPASGAAASHAAAASSSSSQVLAVYDKLHLFDVPSLNGSETYLESARVRPGSEAVLVDCSSSDVVDGGNGLGEGVRIGMSVCYDLRFPQLYRALAQAGASILTVPSAFTVVTGAAHWHALLRARAIETGCFVLAAAQVGTHPGSRKTYGHSLIVNPWGEILADAGGEEQGAGIIVAEIDLDEVNQARNRVPSLLHDRAFTLKTVRA